jgi:hypothetical protein
LSNGFALGAVFHSDYLREYRKEMTNRISLTRLIGGTVAGTQRQLIKEKIAKL